MKPPLLFGSSDAQSWSLVSVRFWLRERKVRAASQSRSGWSPNWPSSMTVVGKGEGFEGEVGVRHVGVRVAGAVADAAVVLVVVFAGFADVPLVFDEVAAGVYDCEIEGAFRCAGEGGE